MKYQIAHTYTFILILTYSFVLTQQLVNIYVVFHHSLVSDPNLISSRFLPPKGLWNVDYLCFFTQFCNVINNPFYTHFCCWDRMNLLYFVMLWIKLQKFTRKSMKKKTNKSIWINEALPQAGLTENPKRAAETLVIKPWYPDPFLHKIEKLHKEKKTSSRRTKEPRGYGKAVGMSRIWENVERRRVTFGVHWLDSCSLICLWII